MRGVIPAYANSRCSVRHGGEMAYPIRHGRSDPNAAFVLFGEIDQSAAESTAISGGAAAGDEWWRAA